MFGKIFKRIKKGDPLVADGPAKVAVEAERQSKLSVSGDLAMWDGPGGPQIRDTRPRRFFAKLTSGSAPGPYAWTEQYPATSGTWTDGYLVGTSSILPAYNTLGGVDLTLPVVVELKPAIGVVEYRFTIGNCS